MWFFVVISFIREIVMGLGKGKEEDSTYKFMHYTRDKVIIREDDGDIERSSLKWRHAGMRAEPSQRLGTHQIHVVHGRQV